MTAFDRFDRFEREIPELMDELAPTRRPDYFDDMLQATARTRQRPAWSALERWLPMGEIARTVPRPTMPWRPIVLFVVLTLIVLAGVLVVAGSQRRLPAPFGPAANGAIVFANAEGDILSGDPKTGVAATLIGGTTIDVDPRFSNDGRRLVFERRVEGQSQHAVWIANSDGADAHQLLAPAGPIDWLQWSPDGERFVLSRATDPFGVLTLVDANNGSTSQVDLEMEFSSAAWRPNHDQLLLTTEVEGQDRPTIAFYLLGADGTGLRQIVGSTSIVNQPAMSPDGSTLAYPTWDSGAEGRIHIIDIDTGRETPIDFAPDFAFTDLEPVFSPDGTKLLVSRYDTDGYRPTILPADGRGEPLPLGVHHLDGSDGANVSFSPDGTQVLATYQDDGTTWLYDTSTGEGRKLDWVLPRSSSASWQRVAP